MFVALARTFGIAARLDPVDRHPQYLVDGTWVDVHLSSTARQPTDESGAKAMVRFRTFTQPIEKLEYYRNFTLVIEDGTQDPAFLDLDEER